MTAEQHAALMMGEMTFQVASLKAENEALKADLAALKADLTAKTKPESEQA